MFQVIICKNQHEIFDHLKVRHIVFVNEQNVSMEEEFDFLDKEAILVNGVLDGSVIATARILLSQNYVKVGRFAVIKEFRRFHFGTQLMNAIETIVKDLGFSEIRLSSQTHAQSFYESIGFVAYGDTYLDANILHIDMVKKIVG
jgi:predicted GNAT family N-acyltransferase